MVRVKDAELQKLRSQVKNLENNLERTTEVRTMLIRFFVVSVIKRLGFIYLIHPYSLLKSCLLIYSEFEHTLLYIYHIHIQMIGTQVLANNLWGLHHLLIDKYRNRDRVWLSTCRCSGNIQSYRTKSNRKHLPKRRMNPKTRTDNSDEVSISKAIMVFFPWNDWRCTQNTGVVV